MQTKRFITILTMFVTLMITTLCYSQSSDSLQNQTSELKLNFQNERNKYDFKIVDSWVYINEFGEIRYDLPKFRVQILERKGRQYNQLNGLYLQSQSLVDQVADANVKLQDEIILNLQPTIINLRNKNDELITKHNRLIVMYNNSLDENEQLNLQLDESKKKAKSYRSQRNWAIGGIVVLVTAAILAR